jgi:hypothetical protein
MRAAYEIVNAEGLAKALPVGVWQVQSPSPRPSPKGRGRTVGSVGANAAGSESSGAGLRSPLALRQPGVGGMGGPKSEGRAPLLRAREGEAGPRDGCDCKLRIENCRGCCRIGRERTQRTQRFEKQGICISLRSPRSFAAISEFWTRLCKWQISDPSRGRGIAPGTALVLDCRNRRHVRWPFGRLASLLARYPDASGRGCASLAPRQPSIGPADCIAYFCNQALVSSRFSRTTHVYALEKRFNAKAQRRKGAKKCLINPKHAFQRIP